MINAYQNEMINEYQIELFKSIYRILLRLEE